MSGIFFNLVQKAQKCGGEVVSTFKQGKDARSIYKSDELKDMGLGSNGICKALCLYWIGYTAKDEKKNLFWDWVGSTGEYSEKALTEITLMHVSYRKNKGQARSTATATTVLDKKERFSAYALERFRVFPSDRPQQTSLNPGSYGAKELTDAILSNNKHFAQLSFHRIGGGHAVTAWVDGNKIRFFDPNYGDYKFSNVDKFKQWFEYFWANTGYQAIYTKSWTVNYYQKK